MSITQFVITALVFTVLGYTSCRPKQKEFEIQRKSTIDQTIDHLIKDGYIKTRKDKNGETILLRLDED